MHDDSDNSIQEQLKESQLKLAHHIENTPLGCISWDINFCCTEWNRSAEKIFGFSAAEAIGQHAALILPEEIHDHINDVYQQLLNQAGGAHSTNENLTRDGDRIICDWYNTPILDMQGEVIGVTSLIQDITERVHAERESKRTRDILEYSQRAAKLGGWELDIKTGELYWTDETYRIHDTSPDEFNPTVDAGVSYFLPESQAIITEALARAMEHGEGYELELETFTTKGRLISIYTTCKVTMKDGKPALLTGIFQDITDRKRASESLQLEQHRLASIFASAADGIVIIDSSGTIISVNQAAERIFRTRADDIVGENVSMLMTESDRLEHDNYIQRYIETGEAKLIGTGREVMGRRLDGTVFPLQLGLSEWLHGGERFFTGMIRDITKQKEVQAQLIQSQKIESLTQLSGGLAHDFNNLLAIIIGNLDMLEEEKTLSPQSLERLSAAIHAAERGADITERMLKLTRVSDQPGGRVEARNMNELLREMVSIFKRTLGPTYDIALNLSVTPLWVRIDPSEFENVILNLCVNARDAMPDGGDIAISTQVLAQDAESKQGSIGTGEWALLVVSDNGAGMSADVLGRIFEPFFSTKQGKGSGLGLAMAYSFANNSGGRIEAKSEPGVGTSIQISLPLAEPANVVASNMPQADTELGGSEKILLVDDEPDLLFMAEQHLKGLGYAVTTAQDAATARSILDASQGFDLLLSDVVMPGGLGTDLAKAAQETQPGIKILLMSGFAETSVSGTGQFELDYPMLRKPFRKIELATMIRQLLS